MIEIDRTIPSNESMSAGQFNDHCWLQAACSFRDGYSDWRMPTPREWLETDGISLSTIIRTETSTITLAPIWTSKVDYDDSWLYCATLYYDSYSDWRLPTMKEYYSGEMRRYAACWYEDRSSEGDLLRTVPVRTI